MGDSDNFDSRFSHLCHDGSREHRHHRDPLSHGQWWIESRHRNTLASSGCQALFRSNDRVRAHVQAVPRVCVPKRFSTTSSSSKPNLSILYPTFTPSINSTKLLMATKVAANSDVMSTTESAVSAKDKALIRDDWVLIKFNGRIAPKIFLKMFTVHPETLSLFPQFAQVPVFELSENLDFMATSHSTMSGLSFIINNMDDTNSLTKLISKMNSPNLFIPKPTAAVPFEEMNRIVMGVLKEELGSAFTNEHVSAWTSLMSFVNQVLEINLAIRPITSEEKLILADCMEMTKQNKKFGANMLLKMFLTHPNTQSLFPNFARVPVSSLITKPEFLAFGKMMISGIEMLVGTIDQPEVLYQLLGNKPYGQYFVADIPIDLQLEETSRLIIDAFDEELGLRFTPITRATWKRAFLLVNSIMKESI